jgi:hypothetical protein
VNHLAEALHIGNVMIRRTNQQNSIVISANQPQGDGSRRVSRDRLVHPTHNTASIRRKLANKTLMRSGRHANDRTAR